MTCHMLSAWQSTKKMSMVIKIKGKKHHHLTEFKKQVYQHKVKAAGTDILPLETSLMKFLLRFTVAALLLESP